MAEWWKAAQRRDILAKIWLSGIIFCIIKLWSPFLFMSPQYASRFTVLKRWLHGGKENMIKNIKQWVGSYVWSSMWLMRAFCWGVNWRRRQWANVLLNPLHFKAQWLPGQEIHANPSPQCFVWLAFSLAKYISIQSACSPPFFFLTETLQTGMIASVYWIFLHLRTPPKFLKAEMIKRGLSSEKGFEYLSR